MRPRHQCYAVLTALATLAACVSAEPAVATGGLAFVHVYGNGDMGIEGIRAAHSVATNSDGGNLYVTSITEQDGFSVGVFRRDTSNGRLSEVQVLHPSVCTDQIKVSADG